MHAKSQLIGSSNEYSELQQRHHLPCTKEGELYICVKMLQATTKVLYPNKGTTNASPVDSRLELLRMLMHDPFFTISSIFELGNLLYDAECTTEET